MGRISRNSVTLPLSHCTVLTLDPAVQTTISYITDTRSCSADDDILHY